MYFQKRSAACFPDVTIFLFSHCAFSPLHPTMSGHPNPSDEKAKLAQANPSDDDAKLAQAKCAMEDACKTYWMQHISYWMRNAFHGCKVYRFSPTHIEIEYKGLAVRVVGLEDKGCMEIRLCSESTYEPLSIEFRDGTWTIAGRAEVLVSRAQVLGGVKELTCMLQGIGSFYAGISFVADPKEEACRQKLCAFEDMPDLRVELPNFKAMW